MHFIIASCENMVAAKGLRPGDILGALTAKKLIDAKLVGKIALFDTRSYVALHHSVAERALALLRQDKIKGRTFRVRLLGAPR